MADINSLVNAVQSGNAVVSGYHSSGRNISWGTINDPTTGEAVGRLYNNAATGETFATPALGDTGEYRINNLSFDPNTGAVGKITDPSQVYFQNPDTSGDFLSNILSNPVTQVALAYYLPGVGEALGAQLGVSSAVGTALASTAVQVANGVDFDTALKNATVNAVVSTGSQDVAKQISDTVGKVGADAITSVGGSIVKTAALGGNSQDMLNNATAALVGSTVSSQTGERALGAAAAGGLTGGVTGAALGAAGALGQPSASDKTTPVASADQQIIDAFTKSQASTDLASLIDNANLTPEERDFLKQAQQSTFTAASTAQALPSAATEVGAGTARLGAPFAANDPKFISALQKNPELISKFSEYTNSYGFNTPELNVVYKGLLEQELQKDPTYQPFLDEYKKVTGQDYVTPEASQIPETAFGEIKVTAPKYTPEITPVPDVISRPGTSVVPGVEGAPALSPAIGPATQPAPAPEPVPQEALSPAGKAPRTIGPEASSVIGVGGYISDKPSTPTSPSTTTRPDVVPFVGGITTETPKDAAPKDAKTAEESKDKPDLFIYGGQSPAVLSRALGTALQAPGGTPTPTTGLTSERAPGEIEGEEGLNRQNVWNEASLRLKDALGI